MKDLLDTVLDTALTVMIAAAIAYALLCAGAYSLTAAEQPLTKDEETIAITLMGEARGEKNQGMYAVACVIQKRADEREITPRSSMQTALAILLLEQGAGKVCWPNEATAQSKHNPSAIRKDISASHLRGWPIGSQLHWQSKSLL